MGEEYVDTPRLNFSSFYARERHSHSSLSVDEDILNISPRLSYHNPEAISLERKLLKRNSWNTQQEILSERHSSTSLAPTETRTSKSVSDLVDEIATLELEVMHLESHLLSLYRSAFDHYLSTSISNTQTLSFDQSVEKTRNSYSTRGAKNDNEKVAKMVSGRRSLGDHLGTCNKEQGGVDMCMSISCPSRLSEEIIKCISAVYCKLAKPAASASAATPHIPAAAADILLADSPDRSFSTSTSGWSPSRSDSPTEKNMIIVPHISIDADRFGFASKMLENFRLMIRRLEKMDPRKMEQEEQLSFWINIHNALVMHAYLAYGLHQNHMKSTHMIVKAAYNVGGHSVNAHAIQSSILGCQPHRPALWMRALFSSKRRSMNGNEGHPFALHRPQPLAHFALCTGAGSDPPVRLYTAKQIYQELEIAKTEFIRANVAVRKQTKILLPRMLYYYGKDATLELCDIVEMVCKCMPESQHRKEMERLCLKRKLDKCVEWVPYKSSFGYVVHRDLIQL